MNARFSILHAWILTRALALAVASFDSGGDAMLFHTFAQLMHDGFIPYRNFVAEYPPLVLLLFRLPHFLADTYGQYRVLWALGMLTCDAGLTVMLLRTGQKVALRYLAFSLPLLGVGLGRFDLLPALASSAAILAWERGRPIGSGLLVGLGTSLKLYPILLVPVLAIDALRSKSRCWSAGAAFIGVVAFALILPTIIFGSFLDWHTDRGLHLESVLATPWLLAPGPLDLDHTFGSYDLAGATTEVLAQLTPWLQATASLATLVWCHRIGAGVRNTAYSLLMIALCFSKTLSPQFLLWVAPLLALSEARGWRAFCFLAAAILTMPIYPFLYDEVVRGWMGTRWLLGARNLFFLSAAIGALTIPPASALPGASPNGSAR